MIPEGATGDGIADDTTALQAWLDGGGSVLSDGVYRITAGLTMNGSRRSLRFDNARLLADTVDITCLTVNGDDCEIRARIDGNNKASQGLVLTGARSLIDDGEYENFHSATNTARAVEVISTAGAMITRNRIRNVHSVGDDVGANGPGFARAIVLRGTTAATARSVISGNFIENITGEEGDAIHTLFFDGVANPFLPSRVTISDNEIRNVSRRFIKAQGSNVSILRNRLTFDLPTAPTGGTTAIDVIQSEYVEVIGNFIEPNLIGGGISMVGTSNAPIRSVVISDNTTRFGDASSQGHIYVVYATEPLIENNKGRGGAFCVAVGGSVRPLVQNNTHFGGINSEISFRVNATNTGAVTRGNVNMSPTRTRPVQNDGAGAVSEMNLTAV